MCVCTTMDVMERIDCDLSAESDISEVSDGLSIVSNDDDLKPSRESDVTATSTITTSMTRSTGSTSYPTSNGVSLRSVLEAPSASAQQRHRSYNKYMLEAVGNKF